MGQADQDTAEFINLGFREVHLVERETRWSEGPSWRGTRNYSDTE